MNAQVNMWVCTRWHAECLHIDSDCVYPEECRKNIVHLVNDFFWYMRFKMTLDAEQVKICIMCILCIMCIIWSLNLLCRFRSVWSSVLQIVCGKILVQKLLILWIASAINSALYSVLAGWLAHINKTYGACPPHLGSPPPPRGGARPMEQCLTRNSVCCIRVRSPSGCPGGVWFAIKTRTNQMSNAKEDLKTR